MGNNPSRKSGCDNCPVEQVTWKNTQEFIKKLNQKTGKTYRLPSEAEWEFAAKGGKKSMGYKYSGSDSVGEVAWYGTNSGSKTHPVGLKSPNELEIFDMSGNVWEWCNDMSGYYSSVSQTNPKGAVAGYSRVIRGGSWGDRSKRCRVSNRSGTSPLNGHGLGLRLVMDP